MCRQRGGGTTPLHDAVQAQDIDTVKALVSLGNTPKSRLPLDINALSDNKYVTALYIACAHGNLPIVQYLVEHGADTNTGFDSPLLAAIQFGFPNLLHYLVEHGADVNRASGQHMLSPLDVAAEYDRPDIVAYLLEHGADPMLTHTRGSEEMIEYVIEHRDKVTKSTTSPSISSLSSIPSRAVCNIVLNYYSGEHYSTINEILLADIDLVKYNKKYHQRMNRIEMQKYEKIIQMMDECFDMVGKTRNTDFVVYRGVRTHAKLRVGESMVLKNYTSTTPNVHRTRPFMTPTCCLYHLRIHKGVRFIDMKSFSQDSIENEILLPRNVIMTYDGEDTDAKGQHIFHFTITKPT